MLHITGCQISLARQSLLVVSLRSWWLLQWMSYFSWGVEVLGLRMAPLPLSQLPCCPASLCDLISYYYIGHLGMSFVCNFKSLVSWLCHISLKVFQSSSMFLKTGCYLSTLLNIPLLIPSIRSYSKLCKWPGSKHFRFHSPHSLCHNYSILWNQTWTIENEWLWLCSHKTWLLNTEISYKFTNFI